MNTLTPGSHDEAASVDVGTPNNNLDGQDSHADCHQERAHSVVILGSLQERKRWRRWAGSRYSFVPNELSFPFSPFIMHPHSPELAAPELPVERRPTFSVLDLERIRLLDEITAIVERHYAHGARTVSIAGVPEFSSAEGCRQKISSLSEAHLRIICSMVTGQRISSSIVHDQVA
ncbi:hypothetical protein HY285_01280 [Candidatus Peregrinibacteria bacterium]|nr:hypothetical protein [Candidatus Peregrinibacteria bacterium]MBI3816160.1 hypothetical protein [Candidatus Peregrinibacteria bacterium]